MPQNLISGSRLRRSIYPSLHCELCEKGMYTTPLNFQRKMTRKRKTIDKGHCLDVTSVLRTNFKYMHGYRQREFKFGSQI